MPWYRENKNFELLLKSIKSISMHVSVRRTGSNVISFVAWIKTISMERRLCEIWRQDREGFQHSPLEFVSSWGGIMICKILPILSLCLCYLCSSVVMVSFELPVISLSSILIWNVEPLQFFLWSMLSNQWCCPTMHTAVQHRLNCCFQCLAL